MWSVFHSEKVSSKVSCSSELPWYSAHTLLVVLFVGKPSSALTACANTILLEAVGTKHLRPGCLDSAFLQLFTEYLSRSRREKSKEAGMVRAERGKRRKEMSERLGDMVT